MAGVLLPSASIAQEEPDGQGPESTRILCNFGEGWTVEHPLGWLRFCITLEMGEDGRALDAVLEPCPDGTDPEVHVMGHWLRLCIGLEGELDPGIIFDDPILPPDLPDPMLPPELPDPIGETSIRPADCGPRTRGWEVQLAGEDPFTVCTLVEWGDDGDRLDASTEPCTWGQDPELHVLGYWVRVCVGTYS